MTCKELFALLVCAVASQKTQCGDGACPASMKGTSLLSVDMRMPKVGTQLQEDADAHSSTDISALDQSAAASDVFAQQHTQRSAKLAAAVDVATAAYAAVLRRRGMILMQDMGEPIHHSNLSSHYEQTLSATRNATLCEACAAAEKEYIEVLDVARRAHTVAQIKAVTLATAAKAHDSLTLEFTQAKKQFGGVIEQLRSSLSSLSHTSESELLAFETLAGQLSPKAKVTTQVERWRDNNKTALDTAQADYGKSAAEARAADDNVVHKKSAEQEACGEISSSGAAAMPPPEGAGGYLPTAKLLGSYKQFKCQWKNEPVPIRESVIPSKCTGGNAPFSLMFHTNQYSNSDLCPLGLGPLDYTQADEYKSVSICTDAYSVYVRAGGTGRSGMPMSPHRNWERWAKKQWEVLGVVYDGEQFTFYGVDKSSPYKFRQVSQHKFDQPLDINCEQVSVGKGLFKNIEDSNSGYCYDYAGKIRNMMYWDNLPLTQDQMKHWMKLADPGHELAAEKVTLAE